MHSRRGFLEEINLCASNHIFLQYIFICAQYFNYFLVQQPDNSDMYQNDIAQSFPSSFTTYSRSVNAEVYLNSCTSLIFIIQRQSHMYTRHKKKRRM